MSRVLNANLYRSFEVFATSESVLVSIPSVFSKGPILGLILLFLLAKLKKCLEFPLIRERLFPLHPISPDHVSISIVY